MHIAIPVSAMVLRRLGDFVVPVSVGLVSFLGVHALGSLVDDVDAPSKIAPFAEARAAAAAGSRYYAQRHHDHDQDGPFAALDVVTVDRAGRLRLRP